MKLILTIVFAVLANCNPSLAQQASHRETGFESMFDGVTLNNWQVMPSEERNAWSVQKGYIVGTGGATRSYLVYKKRDVRNFELRLQYRIPGKGNSGVSIRAVVDETGKRGFQSYHADFGHVGIGKNVLGAWDFHTPGRTEHRCFRGDRLVISSSDEPHITPIRNALTANDVHKNDWNDVRIVARENHFSLAINGKLSSEFTEHLPEKLRLKSGMIQLQLHDPGMVVHFRRLRIRIDE